MWADNVPIYPAPRNSVREPHGRKRGYNGQNRLVLARLVWPSGVIVVPARLLWVDDDVPFPSRVLSPPFAGVSL